ncbi:MAG: DNA mismatch repair protein MutS, partial [Lachnospiraceae bacterium]|nr:DNA mismatch repair protein MutS [Lachnospiraceae bacterium]
MASYTPMMQQYLNTKEQYKDCILFYRLGDFYEMFFEDALVASKVLEITLTGKDCGLEERAPMCGIPYHAVDAYLNKLVKEGYKVAICEQVEDPKTAKGIVKREVIRIVTPGTNTDIKALDSDKNNYLMSISYSDDRYGISAADLSTGDYFVTQVDSLKKLYDEINRYMPSEIICNSLFEISGADIAFITDKYHTKPSVKDERYYDDEIARKKLCEHFGVNVLDGLGLKDYPEGVTAAGALLMYLYDTQKSGLKHLTHIRPYEAGSYMVIDSQTMRNLELTETIREKQKKGSLLWVLDKTKTAMGARLLRSYIARPLIEKDEIDARLDAITEINSRMIDREELREYLDPIYDLE